MRNVTARTIFALALVCFTASCGHVRPPCSFTDFAPAPYDHIIEDLGTLHSQRFHGSIWSKDVEGDLPAELGARFELHGPDGFTAIVPVAAAGRFERDLPSGSYCFKLSAPGFRSTVGTVRIDPAAAESELSIRLLISE